MSDAVVTVPMWLRWEEWIAEGDAAGMPWSGREYAYHLGGGFAVPEMEPGERVYVVYRNKLRGYAPLVRIDRHGTHFALIRAGGAVAVTIPEPIRGFKGWKIPWWKREDERPFPEWQFP